MKKKLLVALMSLIMSTSALATTVFGRPDCGEWVASQGNNFSYKAWMMGYMSGINVMAAAQIMRDYKAKDLKVEPDFLKSISSTEQLFLWVDIYCKRNPLKALDSAGSSLFLELIESNK